jgi:hypothetical protein
MNKVTVNYRRHSKAINNTGINYLINPNYFKSEGFRKLYTYPFLPFDIRFEQKFYWLASQIFRIGLFNRDNKLNSFLKDLLTVYLNPFKYIIWFRKRFMRKLKYEEYYL